MIAIVPGVASTRSLPGRAWSPCPCVTMARCAGSSGSIWKPPGSQYSPAGVVLIQVSGRAREGDIGRRKKSDQAPQRLGVADQDRRLAEIYQAPAVPILQDLIDALPAASGHVAEFSLRDVK